MEISVSIAEAHISGGNMILKRRDENRETEYKKYISEYFEEKFFIKPFICPVCGNTHAFEKGIKCYDYIWIDHQLYRPDDKVCDICAASIRENIKEKWEYFYKTGDRLNFTKDPRYSKYYTRY